MIKKLTSIFNCFIPLYNKKSCIWIDIERNQAPDFYDQVLYSQDFWGQSFQIKHKLWLVAELI